MRNECEKTGAYLQADMFEKNRYAPKEEIEEFVRKAKDVAYQFAGRQIP
mgnify:CR=1 FL=1